MSCSICGSPTKSNDPMEHLIGFKCGIGGDTKAGSQVLTMANSPQLENREGVMSVLRLRAWDNLNKKMLFSKEGSWNDTDPRHIIARIKVPEVITKLGRYFDYEELSEFMSFTGIKDKIGTDLFEGDILKHDEIEPLGVIKFDRGAFYIDGWVDERGNHVTFFYNTVSDEVTIIGNIYENPEMLEATNEN